MQPQSYQSVTQKWSLHRAGNPMAPLQITTPTWMSQGGFLLLINLASQPPSGHHTQCHYPVRRLERTTAEPQRVSRRGRGAENPKAHQLPRDTHSSLLCAQRSSWCISTAWKSPDELFFSTVPDPLLQAPDSRFEAIWDESRLFSN